MLPLLKRIFSGSDHRRNDRRNRFCAESLESRLLLAAVLDSGTRLTIQLEQNEQLEISTDGSGTQFASSNSVFTGVDLEHEAAFGGLGGDSASLNDLAIYDTLRIEAAGDGASVHFVDSGQSAYGHHLYVDLSHATVSDGAVRFHGSSHLGDHDLTIRSSRRVVFMRDSELSTVDGDVDIQVRNTSAAAIPASRGITVFEATISTSGSGDLLLDGKGSDVVADESWKYGVSMERNSRVESTSAAANAGSITLIGQAGNGAGSLYGAFVKDSTISSRSGDVFVQGNAGNGTNSFNVGVQLSTATIESTGTGPGAAVIRLEGKGREGAEPILVTVSSLRIRVRCPLPMAL